MSGCEGRLSRWFSPGPQTVRPFIAGQPRVTGTWPPAWRCSLLSGAATLPADSPPVEILSCSHSRVICTSVGAASLSGSAGSGVPIQNPMAPGDELDAPSTGQQLVSLNGEAEDHSHTERQVNPGNRADHTPQGDQHKSRQITCQKSRSLGRCPRSTTARPDLVSRCLGRCPWPPTTRQSRQS